MSKKIKRPIAKKPKAAKAPTVSRRDNTYRTREMRANDELAQDVLNGRLSANDARSRAGLANLPEQSPEE